MTNRIWKTQLGAALALVALLTATAFAQTSAILSGTVQDPQGNVIGGAKVTVADRRTSRITKRTSKPRVLIPRTFAAIRWPAVSDEVSANSMRSQDSFLPTG